MLRRDLHIHVLAGRIPCWGGTARGGLATRGDGAVVGKVTSGAPSPTLGHPVALARVDARHSAVGTALQVDLRGRPEAFTVVELPFYQRER